MNKWFMVFKIIIERMCLLTLTTLWKFLKRTLFIGVGDEAQKLVKKSFWFESKSFGDLSQVAK